MSDANKQNSPKLSSILPVPFFGLSHALIITLQSPYINKVVLNKALLPKAFALMQVVGNLGDMITMIIAGFIREKT